MRRIDERIQGRYLPAFASYIYDQNQIAKTAGLATINLTSVLIGNGITDISTQVILYHNPFVYRLTIGSHRLYDGRYQIECGTAALDVPFQHISTCVRMKRAVSVTAPSLPLFIFSKTFYSFRDAMKRCVELVWIVSI